MLEYELTRLGETLLEPVAGLADWAEAHRTEIQSARTKFDRTYEKAKRTEERKTG